MVEGERAVQQIIENGLIQIRELFFDESQALWHDEYWQQRVESIGASLINKNNFEEVCDTATPQGVLALCEIPEEVSSSTLASRKGLILATDGIQDPGNMGTMIRTAAWFGVSGLLVGKGSVDIFHPKVVRGTAGATGTIPWQNGMLSEILPEFEQAGWEVILLDASGRSENIIQTAHSGRTIIVVGNEANGINPELITVGRKTVKIDSNSNNRPVESLNAAVSLAIALYEFGS